MQLPLKKDQIIAKANTKNLMSVKNILLFLAIVWISDKGFKKTKVVASTTQDHVVILQSTILVSYSFNNRFIDDTGYA